VKIFVCVYKKEIIHVLYWHAVEIVQDYQHKPDTEEETSDGNAEILKDEKSKHFIPPFYRRFRYILW